MGGHEELENNQKQNHTENGTDVTKKQSAVSSMFWGDFDKLESEAVLENTQVINLSTQNTTKMDKVPFTHTIEKTNRVNILKSDDIDEIKDIDEIEEVEEDTQYNDTIAQTQKTIEISSIALSTNKATHQNENHTELQQDTKKDTAVVEEQTQNVENTIVADSDTKNDADVAVTEEVPVVENQNESIEKEIEQTKIIAPIQQNSENVTQQTQRIDVVQQAVNQKGDFSEILQKTDDKSDTDELGDKNAYLDNFESENFEEEEPIEQEPFSEEDDIYYDEETSLALYQAERRRLKIILFCSVMVGIVVFLVGYTIMGSHQRELREAQKKLEAEQAAAVVDKRNVMVRTIATNRELSVHDINTDEEYIIKTDGETKFINRNGKLSSVTKIQRGDLVSVIMNDDGETAKEIHYSASTWTAREVNGLSVNTEQKTVSITFVNGTEPKTYRYTEDSLFLYKDGGIAPEKIAPCDIVTMQGRGDRVWSIKVIESHGNMTLKNEEDIVNGILDIDNGEKFLVEGFGNLTITEGVHNIFVTGDNIESYEDTIFVVPGEDFVYDLSKAQSKTGVVIIRANVYDFKLYINGADADGSKPIVLPLGEYDVVILKNGYKKWNEKITVVEPSITVDVNMEEDIQESVVSFHSVPAGAKVMWNDEEIGITPFEQTVRYGVYNMEVIFEGYQPYTEKIVVDKSAVNVVSHLTPEQPTAEQDQLQ